jgi:phosphoribosylaminoimidazole-succinocarboxamide synthase
LPDVFAFLWSGNIILVDEIHTPDSSRYWIAGSYEERFKEGKAPENIDKDILRNWYNQHCDPYKVCILLSFTILIIIPFALY